MKFTIRHSGRFKASLPTCGLLFCLVFLGGCTVPDFLDFRTTEDLDLALPSKNLATKGMDDYNVGKYFTALEYFNEILDKYPFSQEAILAELKAADCNYHMSRYAEALALYEEFEERHPTNEAIPYIMFQKAMTHYQRLDRVDRDTTGATESIKLFNQLLRAYPNSPYTKEAQARIKAAEDFLANHEYFVVEFYVRTEKFDQAEQRLNYLLTMYPESTVAERARNLLTQIEAGNPPRSGFKDWFPKLSMPDWKLFGEKS